ncbi:MAG: hypothetical protein ACR2MG_01145 [Pyrinomonadaceae bacterium]
MKQTITITAKSMATELDKWQLTNHNPFQNRQMDGVDSFDKPAFEKSLKKASRKTSQPVAKMK